MEDITKKSFVLYLDYREHLELLTQEQKGDLLDAIFDFVATGNVPELEPVTKMAFSFIKKQLERDKEKYAKTVEKRREAGKLGGRPKKEESKKKQTKAKKANGFSEKQTKAKKPDTDNDNVTDNDTDNVINKKKKKKKEKKEDTHTLFERLLPNYDISSFVCEKLNEWFSYKEERKEDYVEQGMKSLLTRIVNNCKKHGESAVCDLIDESMSNGWKGIIFDRLEERVNKEKAEKEKASRKPVRQEQVPSWMNKSANSRSYDMNALEQNLIDNNKPKAADDP